MPANVETMFYTRVAPWHGLGAEFHRLNRIRLTDSKAMEGNPLIDKAYSLLQAA